MPTGKSQAVPNANAAIPPAAPTRKTWTAAQKAAQRRRTLAANKVKAAKAAAGETGGTDGAQPAQTGKGAHPFGNCLTALVNNGRGLRTYVILREEVQHWVGKTSDSIGGKADRATAMEILTETLAQLKATMEPAEAPERARGAGGTMHT
jgi:hypothetical protein